jgi:hypothetical protein
MTIWYGRYTTGLAVHSAPADKLEHNYHFPARGRSCVTHNQTLSAAGDKIMHTVVISHAAPVGSREVAVAFRFISRRTV